MSSHWVRGAEELRTKNSAPSAVASRFALCLGLGLVIVGATGCLGRSPVVNHYLLGSDLSDAMLSEAVTSAETQAANETYGPAVLVGPVRLPAYLDRPQMARLTSGGVVELDEFARWIGGFEENFLRALTLGVGNRLDSVRVVSHPSKAPFDFDARVRLHVDELVVVDDARLRVRIRWALGGPEAGSTLHLMQDSIPLSDNSARGVVAAHDAVIADLAERIARQISGAGAPSMEPSAAP